MGVVLQVTPSRFPIEESNVTAMLLLAVTAVVSTTTLVCPAAITTAPSGAAAHSAGVAREAQFVMVERAPKIPRGDQIFL